MKIINRADKNLIKKINTNSILKTIRERGPISRADISKIVALNPATVSSNVSDLLDKKIIREVGIGESSGGRKPILLELNSSENYIIGVDMGIKKVTTALVDINGNVINKVILQFSEEKDFDSIGETLKESIYKVVEGYDDNFQKTIGIGMGIHGLVESENGISIYAPAFNWHDINIVDIFQKEFNKTVIIENDTRAMALGEKWFGATKDSKNFILLNIGTGIGAGIYLNGDLYKGNNFGAGEIGHVSMTNEKIKCKCGKYGCFESIASGEGIVNRFESKIKSGRKSSILNKMDISNISSLDIYKEALNGDQLSIEILKETGRYIGTGISMVVNILNPDSIILAGGVSRAREFIYEEIQKTVFEKSMNHNLNNIYIGETSLKQDAGIIGAATLVIRDLFSI
ncbi:ROK family transcriptional regulator [Oceanirhabdus seepicola]|uniref:ROK family transcriptional regulator n=1 Tax=Oceanirhabdus seepicola TaxID=2828781 RepID=A0A9J6NWT5_9CLOT|nr:ROK family transcriptional regulator [Oceanirhabdus seepicola]MCM1988369.1 ROK family transcriptional regulator [Oceanirhabdus seepicola]